MSTPRRTLVVAAAALAVIFGSAGCGSSPGAGGPTDAAVQPPADAAPLPDAAAPPPPVFGFFEGADDVSRAMTTLVRNGDVAPETQEAGDEWFRQNNAAEAYVLGHLPEVQVQLLAAVRALPPGRPNGYYRLMRLLELAGQSPELLIWYRDLALAPVTADESAVGPNRPPPGGALVRGVAIGLLYHHARAGHDAARPLILAAASSPAVGARTQAVQYYLRLSRDRRLAQRELAARLPAESRYLLYQF